MHIGKRLIVTTTWAERRKLAALRSLLQVSACLLFTIISMVHICCECLVSATSASSCFSISILPDAFQSFDVGCAQCGFHSHASHNPVIQELISVVETAVDWDYTGCE